MTDEAAGVIETHVSTVFFAGDRAYKLLKPISTGFLDHSSTEVRVAAARREVELNRRLAPSVYLGEADVVEDGRLVDRLIVMRRLPHDRRLADLVDEPDVDDHLRRVVHTVAAFHEGLTPIGNRSGPASRQKVTELWEASLEEMNEHVERLGRRDQHDQIGTLALDYLAGREAVFEERIDAGLQRDGHGDLLAQDIFCLDEGPQILDCLAFRDDLRIGDVLNDVAFLAMDLERLGGPDLGRRVIELYDEFTNEHHPASLAHHFIAYRALVRSKVAGIRASQGATKEWSLAEQLHEIALDHLRAGEVRAIMVGGAPGTGKTTVAAAIADRHGSVVLSSDEVRKEVAGMSHQQSATAGPDTGIYDPAHVDEAYQALLDRAVYLVGRGESVVLDASWTSASHREACRDAMAMAGARLSAIECVLDPTVAAQRVAARREGAGGASDATPDIARLLADRRDPWPGAAQIDTDADLDDVTEQVLRILT